MLQRAYRRHRRAVHAQLELLVRQVRRFEKQLQSPPLEMLRGDSSPEPQAEPQMAQVETVEVEAVQAEMVTAETIGAEVAQAEALDMESGDHLLDGARGLSEETLVETALRHIYHRLRHHVRMESFYYRCCDAYREVHSMIDVLTNGAQAAGLDAPAEPSHGPAIPAISLVEGGGVVLHVDLSTKSAKTIVSMSKTRPEPPKQLIGRGWPKLGAALRHDLALKEASGEPAGRATLYSTQDRPRAAQRLRPRQAAVAHREPPAAVEGRHAGARARRRARKVSHQTPLQSRLASPRLASPRLASPRLASPRLASPPPPRLPRLPPHPHLLTHLSNPPHSLALYLHHIRALGGSQGGLDRMATALSLQVSKCNEYSKKYSKS